MSYDIHDPIFTDEDQAREHLESVLGLMALCARAARAASRS